MSHNVQCCTDDTRSIGSYGADNYTPIVVSRAFQVLSDPDKKSKFDRFGEDPDNRFAGGSSASASPFSGFARSQGGAGGGATWEDEISPEEMFRQFFGGGIGRGGYGSPFGIPEPQSSLGLREADLSTGGGIFDTGPGFVFNVGGGPGVRIHQFGGANPRRRPRNADGTMPQPSVRSALSNLLPLLVLFLLPLLTSLFSGTGSNTPSGPSFRFDTPAPPYTMHRTTNSLKVNYYVNPVEVDRLSNRDLLNLDKRAEVSLLNKLKNECEDEVDRRRRMVQDAQGWFSNDREKMQQAMGMEMKSCKRLEGFGYTVTNRY